MIKPYMVKQNEKGPLTKDQMTLIDEMYTQGENIAHIARLIGRKQYLVERYIAKARAGKISEEAKNIYIDRGKIFALAKAGWSAKTIAGDMGLDVELVKDVLAGKIN